MRLAAAAVEVDVIGLDNSKPFLIEATGKAFSILSSTLYRDKIKAVVREIGTNAQDAHVLVGNADLPFRVHLPNTLEPFFSIRDYGPGLSPTAMDEVYRRYFNSTKTHSNRFVGALGLGSKSPFAYTASFSVISYQDGIKRIYVVYKDRTGCPNYDLMTETMTDEPNGLEVSIPVPHASDFAMFASRAADVYSRFEPRPNVVGKPDFEFAVREYVLDGKGWRIANYGPALAIMGPIAYQITPDDLSGHASSAILKLLSKPVEIDFKIGDLDFQPGREDLSYDPETIKILITRAERVLSEIHRRVQDKFDECQTMLEARALYASISDTAVISDLLEDASFQFRGKTISSPFVYQQMDEFPSLHVVSYTNDEKRHRANYHWRRTALVNGFEKFIDASPLSFSMRPGKKVTVVKHDMEKGGNGRIRNRRSTFPSEILIVVDGPDADFDLFVSSELDGAQIKRLSELPPPIRYVMSSGERIRRIYRLNNVYSDTVLSYGFRSSSEWTAEPADQHPDAEFYIPLTSNRVPLDSVPSNLGTMMKAAKNVGLLPTKIYGLTPLPMKKAKEAGSGWTSVWEEIKNRAEEAFTTLAADFKAEACLLTLKTDWPDLNIDRVAGIAQHLDQDHPLVQFANELKAVRSVPNSAQFRELAKTLGVPLPSEDDSFSKRWTALLDRYPLMWPIIVSTDQHGANVAAYMKMIDKELGHPL